VPSLTEAGELPYGSYRVNRDLQIWLVEGREFRSPNNMPDGPRKSLWGARQRDWLKRTLLASDAAFKILIHPTPLVGPQGNGSEPFPKMDNHINPKGFRFERQAFFEWLAKNDFMNKGFFIICGDSHWPYRSIDPSGFEEFCTGALVTQNATVGERPGDPNCSDPEGRIKQPFHPESAMATFLQVEVARESEDGEPLLRFTHRANDGRILYTVEKSASK
jgi:alkaline phosphatase D